MDFLQEYFCQRDVDFQPIWGRIDNIVNLTLLSIAPSIAHNPPCFELYGFDIIVDKNFKPWYVWVSQNRGAGAMGAVKHRHALGHCGPREVQGLWVGNRGPVIKLLLCRGGP